MAKAADWRGTINDLESEMKSVLTAAPGTDAVPPELVEAVINIESGGDMHVGTSSAGATGLMQIVPGGLEYDAYLDSPLAAKYGTDLNNPKTNIAIGMYGLDYRQRLGEQADLDGQPHAWEDWYMSAAGYLGGADESGFNGASDSFGTTGGLYVKRVRQYIEKTFGFATANAIDEQQPGAARLKGYPTLTPWSNPSVADAPVEFDPNANAGGNGILDPAKDAISGVTGDVSGAIRTATASVGVFAERAGLFLAGALILLFGLVVAVRGVSL